MLRRVPRRTTLVAVTLLPLLLAGCGSDPEPLEALPPPAPSDLCSLLPPAATEGLTGSASSDEEGNPTAACALSGARGDSVLVTWLQLQDPDEATNVYESQCVAIDRTVLPEQPASVDGADQTCAGASDGEAPQRSSLVVRAGREVVTVRVSTSGASLAPLDRATTLASGLLPNLPRPQ